MKIRQIWRILRQNCSDDSTEVTEGVTLTLKFLVTSTVLSLPFSQQIQFTLIVNVVNLNEIIKIKELCYITKQEEGKLPSKFTR